MYEVKLENKVYKVEAYKANYIENGGIAVMLATKKEPFADITVNVVGVTPTDQNCAFVDTNNNKWAEKFLQTNGIATPTGRSAINGYCSYPEYRFDLSKLKSFEEETKKENSGEDVDMNLDKNAEKKRLTEFVIYKGIIAAMTDEMRYVNDLDGYIDHYCEKKSKLPKGEFTTEKLDVKYANELIDEFISKLSSKLYNYGWAENDIRKCIIGNLQGKFAKQIKSDMEM